jgi:hypothetical protein
MLAESASIWAELKESTAIAPPPDPVPVRPLMAIVTGAVVAVAVNVMNAVIQSSAEDVWDVEKT